MDYHSLRSPPPHEDWSFRQPSPTQGPSSRTLSLPFIPLLLLPCQILRLPSRVPSLLQASLLPARVQIGREGTAVSSGPCSIGRSPHLLGINHSNPFYLDRTSLLAKWFGLSYLI